MAAAFAALDAGDEERAFDGVIEAIAATPDADRRVDLRRAVVGVLDEEMDGDAVQDLLYSTAIDTGLKPKKAFAAIYKVLVGKTSGPKAGPFVAGLGVPFVRERFSRVSGDTEGWDGGR